MPPNASVLPEGINLTTSAKVALLSATIFTALCFLPAHLHQLAPGMLI
jgi:hypothetical protein